MQKDIVILSVISAELKWLSKTLGISLLGKDRHKTSDGTNYWHGSIKSALVKRTYSVAITCIGSGGNPECATATMEAIKEYRPKVVFLVGIAAGERRKIKIGEVVFSERVVAYEGAAINTTKKGEMEVIPRPDMPHIPHVIQQDISPYMASLNLTRIEKKFRALKGNYPKPPKGKKEEYRKHVSKQPNLIYATIASGDKLLRHPTVLYTLRTKMHGKIAAGEMEASGFATACSRANLPWLVVRGISDFGDRFKSDKFHEFAARMAALALRDFIARGLDLGTNRSRYRQAYDETASGHMLSRERLSKRDIETGSAVRPAEVDAIARDLKKGKTVAIQGEPGCGKSALAAWVNWVAEQDGQFFATFQGRNEQNKKAEDFCSQLELVPSDHILIIDDIHLIEEHLASLKAYPWAGGRRYLLLARYPFIYRALRDGKMPRVDRVVKLTRSDANTVAETLVRKYIRDEAAANKVLDRSDDDLVLTKWLLEAVVVNKQGVNYDPQEAALKKLDQLHRDAGGELLRLYLTLAALGWLELWCPESFLVDLLGFEFKTLRQLEDPLHETERQQRPQTEGSYLLRLLRHPRLCRLFLDAAPRLGLLFDRLVVAVSAEALKLTSQVAVSYKFEHLILGGALTEGVADLSSMALRFVYAGQSADFVQIAKVGAHRSLVRSPGMTGLTLEEKVGRLKFAFAAASGERRLHRARAGKLLLEELQRQLGVSEIPNEPFPEKGFMLYEDAYLMRLDNAGQRALDQFENSAVADEEWATQKDSMYHRAGAVMSRIAAVEYGIDLAVFTTNPAPGDSPNLRPNREELMVWLKRLEDLRDALETMLKSSPEDARRRLRIFHKNALKYIAEASGWIGDTDGVKTSLDGLKRYINLDDTLDLHLALVRGALAFTKNFYGKVIAELDGQHIVHLDRKSGEVAGKIGAMLLLANLYGGSRAKAEQIRLWLVSEQCPLDAGNGLAKVWAASLGPLD